MRNAILYNSISAWRIAMIGIVFLGLSSVSKNLCAQSAASIEIRSEALSVTLDAKFPRVFKYQTATGKSLPAALESSRPTIKLNGQLYTAGDLDVRVQSTVSDVTYGVRVPSLNLGLDWRFAIEGSEIVFELTKVSEGGSFRLQTLEFPHHYLVRVPAAEGKGEAYRGEYERQKWSDPYSNLLWQSTAHFMKISEADGEEYPKDTNWASADVPGVVATISDNIPYWKLKTQVLGGEGPGTDFAMWLGTYYYRIAGDVQPLLQSRVAVLTEDRNHDGAVDWMEAALWHRDHMRTPSNTYEPKTFVYIVFIDWVKPVKEPPGGYAPPITSFAETLEIVRAVAKVTGNAKQRVTLVGWQFTGHDTGYPALNQVNERAGGAAALRKLVKDAAEYNANIEYHINLNDAYPDNPFFDPSVLQFNREGKPYVWSYQFEGGPPDYRISNTKQFRSGYFQRRTQSFLDTVPVSEGIRLDTFRNCDISVGPGEDIGIVSETVYGAKILDWFTERGIVPLTEGPVDAYYGKSEGVQHRFVISDPFQLMMMQGKLYGGGKLQEGVGQALGWSMNLGYSFRETNEMGGLHLTKYSEAEIADMYFLGNLTQSYLLKKNLIWLGTEKVGEKQVEKNGKTVTVPRNKYIARFSDGTVSTVLDDGSWTVVDHDFKSVDGQRRVIPIGDKEIVLYSVDGGAVDWTLPSQWAQARISAAPVDSSVAAVQRYIVGSDSKVEISTKSRTAYILRREN
ncbi:MAG: endo-alpha-N-acetylgalactosaminidase family protein [Candidatus Sulfotelmatobacter sp.]